MKATTIYPENKEIRFFLRTSYKNIKPFYFLSSFLFIAGTLLLVRAGTVNEYFGITIISLGFLVIVILLSQDLTYKSFYAIYPDYLLLQRGFNRRTIRLEDIKEVAIISREQVKEDLMRYRNKEISSRVAMNEMESFTAQRRFGKFIAYCTIPIFLRPVSHGDYEVVIDGDDETITGNDFILLTSKTGTRLLLSPRDCEEFVKAINGYLS